MTNIAAAIPVYNNATTILDIARRARAQIPTVIVIDDGSTDANLPDLLKSLDITVIRREKNLGKGAALLTAFNHAAALGIEYLITLDADGQHFPEDLPCFLPHLSPATLLIGSREEITGIMPRSSLFGRDFSDFWLCIETGANVRDSQSGFRAYPLKNILALPLASRHYNMEVEVIARALWAGLSAKSIPIRVWYPDRDKRISSFHPLRDNLRIALLHARLVLRCLLPIPHRQIIKTRAPRPSHFLNQNASPLGLAFAALITIIPNIVLWPWGFIPTLYLALRLHLNKPMFLAIIALTLPRAVPALCIRIGQSLLSPKSSPHLIWIVGSHILAFIAAPTASLLVYFIARNFRRRSPARSENHP